VLTLTLMRRFTLSRVQRGCGEHHDPFGVPRPWTAFQSDDYGYTRMNVFNATHMYLEQVSDDQGGKVIDQMWLIKSKHGPYSYFR